MSTTFDPYRVWLGIPVEEQPANHYRLLGIGLFESDPMVISNAADRQMAHIRTFQNGKHVAISQKILNELAAVRVTLLDSQRKAQYDDQLRATLPQATSVLPPTVAVPVFNVSPKQPTFSKRNKVKKQSPEWVIGGVLIAVGILLVLYLSFPAQKKSKAVPKRPEITKEEKTDTVILPASQSVVERKKKRETERAASQKIEEETSPLAVVSMESAEVGEELCVSPNEKKNFDVVIYHSSEEQWKKDNLQVAKERIQKNLIVGKTKTAVLDFTERHEAEGHFPNNFQIPGGPRDYYTLVANVDVVFTEETAGLWTFGLLSDDGYEITVWDDAGEVMIQNRHASGRLMAWENSKDYAVAVFPPGRFHIEVIQFDNFGDSGVELYAAPGVQSAFSPQFRLIGGVGNGGLPMEPFTEPWKE